MFAGLFNRQSNDKQHSTRSKRLSGVCPVELASIGLVAMKYS